MRDRQQYHRPLSECVLFAGNNLFAVGTGPPNAIAALARAHPELLREIEWLLQPPSSTKIHSEFSSCFVWP